MPDLEPAVEQTLAELSDADWAALTARVRPPSSAAQLKEIAGRVLSGPQLDAFVSVANLKAVAGENGDIDETKVMGVLTGMFGVADDSGPAHQDFGQYRQPPPMPGPGDRGRAEAAKRFGAAGGAEGTQGRGGRDEAERRFGKRQS
jgi:hypothetical protein